MNNNFDLPRFERQLMRPARQTEEELGREIWFPNWKCFCCHDTGVVNPRLVALVIPDYNLDKDKLPCCQNSTCTEGQKYIKNPKLATSLDWRFSDRLCQKLDAIEREEWRVERNRTIDQLNIIDFAAQKSLRRGHRTELENEKIAQQHEIERSK